MFYPKLTKEQNEEMEYERVKESLETKKKELHATKTDLLGDIRFAEKMIELLGQHKPRGYKDSIDFWKTSIRARKRVLEEKFKKVG